MFTLYTFPQDDPLSDAEAVRNLLSQLDTNNNACGTVAVVDGNTMKQVPVVRTESERPLRAHCFQNVLTFKIQVPDEVMILAAEAGVDLSEHASTATVAAMPTDGENIITAPVMLPDGTLINLPAKPDAGKRYYEHIV